jgi:hypothetical protein
MVVRSSKAARSVPEGPKTSTGAEAGLVATHARGGGNARGKTLAAMPRAMTGGGGAGAPVLRMEKAAGGGTQGQR